MIGIMTKTDQRFINAWNALIGVKLFETAVCEYYLRRPLVRIYTRYEDDYHLNALRVGTIEDGYGQHLYKQEEIVNNYQLPLLRQFILQLRSDGHPSYSYDLIREGFQGFHGRSLGCWDIRVSDPTIWISGRSSFRTLLLKPVMKA